MPMRREERQRKYHEALLNMLYPPPPSPPQQEDEEEVVATLPEGFNVNSTPDDQEESGSSSSSDDDELERGPQKLSRAQRKRFRKKKLKETALQRRKIVGPLLPSTTNEGGGSGNGNGGDALENEPPSVRHNATEGHNSATEEPGYTSSNKLKHRRKAKREGKEKASSSNMVKSDQESPQPCVKDGNSGPNLDGGREELEQLPDQKSEA